MIKQNPKSKVWPKGTTDRDKWMEYTRLKREFFNIGLSSQEYEERIRDLVDYLGI